ncbi:MAG: hypothetical protein DRI69_01915 [Bacteroidetes bacterium]|nr:MAG: hypothetical protein DRI69_01915 [Bacteroidota bacterium]
MRPSWFNDVYSLEKKSYSDLFGTEPFIPSGTIRGFMQPITGRLSNASGKTAGEAAYMLYTPLSSNVEPGDKITGRDGRAWIAQFVQSEGIAGTKDHQEVTVELLR